MVQATAGQHLLTVEEAAMKIRICRRRVFSLIASGELESVKIGKSRRVPADAIDSYIASLRGEGRRTA